LPQAFELRWQERKPTFATHKVCATSLVVLSPSGQVKVTLNSLPIHPKKSFKSLKSFHLLQTVYKLSALINKPDSLEMWAQQVEPPPSEHGCLTAAALLPPAQSPYHAD
jgi:hypothetical protein